MPILSFAPDQAMQKGIDPRSHFRISAPWLLESRPQPISHGGNQDPTRSSDAGM